MLSFFSTAPLEATLASFSLLALGVVALRSRRKKVASVHFRGRRLKSSKEAKSILDKCRPPSDPGLLLGRSILPSHAANSHIAVVGATGSGKTIIQRLLMQSALPLIGKSMGHRALVYDPKQDIASILAGMRLTCPIHLLNPLDRRSVSWNMAADITTAATALQVASILIPKADNDSNPFFSNAARHLFFGAILSYISQGNTTWNFRDLLLTVRDASRLRMHLEQSEYTQCLTQYFEHPGTFQNILSTILSHLLPFEVIAAAWDRAEKTISLNHWVNEESILVLGNDEANREAIDAMNRLIFQRISELVLAKEETSSDRSWFFIDEVREAGRLNGLSRLLTKGRSKGAAIVLGFQDICGLHDLYGKEVAEELLGQCSTRIILRLNSPDTATWASRTIGEREILESKHGQSRDNRSLLRTGESVSHGIERRPLVLESELFDFPTTTPENGLTGLFITPFTGAFMDHLPGSLISKLLLSPDPQTRNFVSRPDVHQLLRPFSESPQEFAVASKNSRQPWRH